LNAKVKAFMVNKYDFYKTKYGNELLIDLIRLESLEKYIFKGNPHTLSYYDITLITDGKGTFRLDNQTFDFTPGRIIFSSPGQVRYWDIEVMPTGYVLIFEEEFLTSFLNDIHFIDNLKYFYNYSSPPEITISQDEQQFLIPLFINIEQEIATFNKNDTHILKALLYQSLIWLNRKYISIYTENNSNELNRHILSFRKLTELNFSTHHDVTFYADRLNITQGHLNDLCKKHLGVSAKQYIQNRLMTEAKKLICFTDASIAQIASNLNFEDTSYFVRKFRKSTGHTPLNYRRENP
jgi:AraC-like DNA-binding protein